MPSLGGSTIDDTTAVAVDGAVFLFRGTATVFYASLARGAVSAKHSASHAVGSSFAPRSLLSLPPVVPSFLSVIMPNPAAASAAATTSAIQDDRELLPAETVHRILGFDSVSAMNNTRRELEQWWLDPVTGVVHSVPDFAQHAEVQRLADPAARSTRAAELNKAFRESNVLVIPIWGAIKWPKQSWRYNRVMCERVRDRQLAAFQRVI